MINLQTSDCDPHRQPSIPEQGKRSGPEAAHRPRGWALPWLALKIWKYKSLVSCTT